MLGTAYQCVNVTTGVQPEDFSVFARPSIRNLAYAHNSVVFGEFPPPIDGIANHPIDPNLIGPAGRDGHA
jgi:hypothetical protein